MKVRFCFHILDTLSFVLKKAFHSNLCKGRGSIEEVQKYCFLLKDNLASSLSTLSLLLKDNNRVALAKETHKLKGVLSLVTLPALQQAVENFSDHLKKQDSETIDLVFLAVENENQRFLKELKSL